MGTKSRSRRRRRRRNRRARRVLLADEDDSESSLAVQTINKSLDDNQTLLKHLARSHAIDKHRKQSRHETKHQLATHKHQASQALGVVVRLSNLPFSACDADVVNLVAAHLRQRSDVLGCRLQYRVPRMNPLAPPRPSGVAMVALANERAMDRLLAACTSGMRLFGSDRIIHGERWRGPQGKRYLKQLQHSRQDNFYPLQSVRVGTQIQFPMAADAPFIYRWSNEQNATLRFEDECVRMDCVNDFVRLEVRFLDLFKLVVNGKSGNQMVKLRFGVRHPPRCFRRLRNPPKLEEEISCVWSISEWRRTVDLSLNGAFGLCSMIECVFDLSGCSSEVLIESLREKFTAKGLKCTIQRGPELPSHFESIKGLLTAKRPECFFDSLGTCMINDSTGDEPVQTIALQPISSRYDKRFAVGLKHCSPNRDWHNVLLNCFAHLPFRVRYYIHTLLGNGKLWFVTVGEASLLSSELSRVLSQGTVQASDVCALMNDLLYCWGIPNPVQRLTKALHELVRDHKHDLDAVEEIPDPTDFETLRVFVTPLRICPQPPSMEGDNRILRQFRHFGDRFIRVTFVDENFGPFHCCKSDDIMVERIRKALKEGIDVAGRRYVFLAYSNSQLREQSCWFYDEEPRAYAEDAGRTIISANGIRQQIGDLSSILVAAKYGSRLGQAFSETRSTVQVLDQSVVTIRDIERNDCCFTDGVGMISASLARQVASKLELDEIPSAFQIRFAGAKGVVTVWPDHFIARRVGAGHELVLRPSMTKFVGRSRVNDLEVCNIADSRLCFLNQQMIVILSALGISDQVFLTMLEDAINLLDAALVNVDAAKRLATLHSGSSVAMPMLKAGFDLSDELLFKLIVAIRDRCLLDIQRKARIYIPKGVRLIGVVDETEILPAGTVFLQADGVKLLHGTRVVVGRSPCLHPGDIRVLAVHTLEVHELEHLNNVVVFSARGVRPDCNMMGGGDLDGDEYFIIWDQRLVPLQASEPMQYGYSGQNPHPEASSKVSVEDVQHFFADYLENDVLGLVCHAHVAWADQSQEGPFSPECMELASHHSVAVDFAKTGVPAKVPNAILFPPKYPHYMEKTTRSMYDSTTILGKIYDIAKKTASVTDQVQQISVSRGYDPDLVIEGHEQYVDDAMELMGHYCWDLYAIAQQFGVDDEGELLSGHARKLSRRAMSRHRGVSEAATRLRRAVHQLQRKYAAEFWAEFEFEEQADDEDDAPFQAVCKASA